jgi:hypothetical protein
MHVAPLWQTPPRQERIKGPLLLALFDTGFAGSLRNDVIGAQAELSGFIPWLDVLLDAMGRDPVAALVAHQMLPQARDDARMERQRRGATEAARERNIAEARAALHSQLDDLRRLAAADKALGPETIAELLAALERFQQTCHRALSMGYADSDYRALCHGSEKLSAHALTAQQALVRCEELHGVNAIFLRPERLAIAATVAMAILVLRVPWLILALVLVTAAVLGYRWYRNAMARHAAKAALRWLQLHAKTIDPGN